VARATAVREAVGDTIEILVDANSGERLSGVSVARISRRDSVGVSRLDPGLAGHASSLPADKAGLG
jgi:hypothetical protein